MKNDQVEYIKGRIGIPRKGVLACDGARLTLTRAKDGKVVFDVSLQEVEKISIPQQLLNMQIRTSQGLFIVNWANYASGTMLTDTLNTAADTVQGAAISTQVPDTAYGHGPMGGVAAQAANQVEGLMQNAAASNLPGIQGWIEYFKTLPYPNAQPVIG